MGELKDDLLESRSVVEGNGSVTVTLPSEAAEDLDINPGDRVVFTGSEGDRSLEVQTTETILASD